MSERSTGAAGITALLVGLLAVPWGYIAIGALGSFSWPIPAIFLAGFGISTLWLAIECFAPLRGKIVLRVVLSTVALLIWGYLLNELSNFSLLTDFERLTYFCTIWCVLVLACLAAFALIGETRLEHRIRTAAKGRGAVLLGIFVMIFCALLIVSLIGFMAPAQFV